MHQPPSFRQRPECPTTQIPSPAFSWHWLTRVFFPASHQLPDCRHPRKMEMAPESECLRLSNMYKYPSSIPRQLHQTTKTCSLHLKHTAAGQLFTSTINQCILHPHPHPQWQAAVFPLQPRLSAHPCPRKIVGPVSSSSLRSSSFGVSHTVFSMF